MYLFERLTMAMIRVWSIDSQEVLVTGVVLNVR